jgi:hypothetical protein
MHFLHEVFTGHSLLLARLLRHNSLRSYSGFSPAVRFLLSFAQSKRKAPSLSQGTFLFNVDIRGKTFNHLKDYLSKFWGHYNSSVDFKTSLENT